MATLKIKNSNGVFEEIPMLIGSKGNSLSIENYSRSEESGGINTFDICEKDAADNVVKRDTIEIRNGVQGEQGQTYTLSEEDKTEIATIAAPLVGTDFDTRITQNTNAITALQGKHLYMHMILFKWWNSDRTKSVHAIMTIINTSSTDYTIKKGTISNNASRQTLLKQFRDGCLSAYPHECSGSFYGVPYTNIYSQQDGTFFITGIKKILNGTTGNDYIGIIADPLEKVEKTHEGTTYYPVDQAGETVMQIDYNTAGTVDLTDNVITLI